MIIKFSQWLSIREDAAAAVGAPAGGGGGGAPAGGGGGGAPAGGDGTSTSGESTHEGPGRPGATTKGDIAGVPMRLGCCGCGFCYPYCKCKKKKKKGKRKHKRKKK